MIKRSLGRCGLSIGEVGLGCEGLLDKDEFFISKALDMMGAAGASGIDLYSPNPDFRSRLGKALAGRRKQFILQGHICSCWQNGQYKRSRYMPDIVPAFEDQLHCLDTDYIDIGMIHYVDAMKDWHDIAAGPILPYVQDLKARGTIRAIGLSSHNPQAALAAVESGIIDVLMFSINPCYDLQPPGEDVEQLWNREKYKNPIANMDPDRARLYETCDSLGVGITVMKAFGGGDLLKADQSLAGVALTETQCIAYALDRPGAACVFAGAHSLHELQKAMDFAKATPEEKDYAATLASFPRISWRGHCMYCGHCAPCPKGISIADVTKLLNLAKAQGAIPETVREHYAALPHKAGECINCGKCAKRCPFEVDAPANMAAARELFGA